MASSAADIKVSLIEPVCKTLIKETESNTVENGQQQHDEEENSQNSPARLYLNPSDSSVYMNKTGPAIGIAMSATEEVREVYLKNIFMMPQNHEFYCPSCDVCINKVLFCTTRQQQQQKQLQDINVAIQPIVLLKGPAINYNPEAIEPQVIKGPDQVIDVPRVTVPADTVITGPDQVMEPGHHPEEDVECLVRCSACFSLLIEKGKEFFTGLVSRGVPEEQGHVTIPIMPRDPTPITSTRPESTKGWEILKSIVYGGLAELLASLSVVTSAASADATTLSIVALGVANLIGGLSVLGHNLRDLKASQQPGEETQVDDKYYELLGKRENFYLHAFFAILSFLIFGLVPPVAFGFSFRESDDKDLKLAAVALASLICITLLGIAKAHVQRQNTFMTYFKTVAFYVTSGILASLLTYEAGAMMKKLVEQVGWFDPKPSFGLALHEMSNAIEKFGWGSY